MTRYRLERREHDVSRLTTRNAYLKGELKQLERHHTNALKEIVVLKQKATAAARACLRGKSQRQRDGRPVTLPGSRHHPTRPAPLPVGDLGQTRDQTTPQFLPTISDISGGRSSRI
jgi:hypothetical protein